MLLNVSSGLYENHFFIYFLRILLRVLQLRALKITVSALKSASFSQIIVKRDKDIYCPKISDKLDCGGSASFDMPIMDHVMNWPI